MMASVTMNVLANQACISAVVCSPSACSTGEQPYGVGGLGHCPPPWSEVGKATTPSTAIPASRLTQKSGFLFVAGHVGYQQDADDRQIPDEEVLH